ncbi:FAD-dependent monooxygenase [Viridibacterium curvum]|uniref:FAD-dependent monooxygenase n=1 Tax=Viridibacterium curvum TaxID=1101404 RepID=UPI0031E7686C
MAEARTNTPLSRETGEGPGERAASQTRPSPGPAGHPAPRPTAGIALPAGCAGVEQSSTNSLLAPQTGEGKNIIVVGAGPLGLCAGLRLAAQGHSVQLLDARRADQAHEDRRVLALSHGSRQLLETLGAWPAQTATPITTIHVSQRGALGRTEMRHADYGLPALGYVLPASALMQALLARARDVGLDIRYDARVEALSASATQVSLNTRSEAGAGDVLHATLAVCCEGRIDEPPARQNSVAPPPKRAGRKVLGRPGDFSAASSDVHARDYDQHALLLRVTPAQPHANTAWERFTPDGPIALLPQGGDFGVVWTMSPERLATLKALPDDALLAELQRAFGLRVHFSKLHSRASYPLGMKMRKSPVGDRTVWLGNAAQTLHPVAGQGFNLGLRDAWELADTLRAATDPGAADVLARYARQRRADRQGAAGFTDSLVRLFSNNNPLLTHARGAGLLALDICPPLRHFVTKRMIFGARAWP